LARPRTLQSNPRQIALADAVHWHNLAVGIDRDERPLIAHARAVIGWRYLALPPSFWTNALISSTCNRRHGSSRICSSSSLAQPSPTSTSSA
jgi:hypothetical protein